MTTPTSNIGLSTVQSEFGGSNPISLSEYYRSAAYVPANTSTSAADGSPIPSSGAIRLGMFRGLDKVILSPLYAGSMGTITRSGSISTMATGVSVTFTSDGMVVYTSPTPFTATPFSGSTNVSTGNWWYNGTPTPGIGNGYYVLATAITGTVDTAHYLPTGTWYQMSVDRTWGATTSTRGTQSDVYLKMDISNTAGGTILASGICRLTATYLNPA